MVRIRVLSTAITTQTTTTGAMAVTSQVQAMEITTAETSPTMVRISKTQTTTTGAMAVISQLRAIEMDAITAVDLTSQRHPIQVPEGAEVSVNLAQEEEVLEAVVDLAVEVRVVDPGEVVR